jgi:hypothetical protein
MKTIIILLFLCQALSAQINLRIGDSEIKGLAGIEAKLSHYSIAAGWRPYYINHHGYEQSFCSAVTYYINPRGESIYLSAGVA